MLLAHTSTFEYSAVFESSVFEYSVVSFICYLYLSFLCFNVLQYLRLLDLPFLYKLLEYSVQCVFAVFEYNAFVESCGL